MICTFGDITDVTWWRELALPTRVVIEPDGRLKADPPDAIAEDGGIAAYAEHDASRSLDGVRAPTLVVTGERDWLAPAAVMQQIARHLPRSEILVVPGAHHLVFAEYPDLVNLRLERFFEDVGWC